MKGLLCTIKQRSVFTKKPLMLLLAGIFLFTVFLLSSCGSDSWSSSGEYFHYDLQGTWFSNESSVYSGELIIDFSKITINGYYESQTPSLGDANERPFKNYTKNIELKGYSVEDSTSSYDLRKGEIFIEDYGELQEGIPYTCRSEYTSENKRIKLLSFTFGGRIETLRYIDN